MRLQIGPSIDNSKVRLDFRKSPVKPDNTPSYEIEKTKADEFVKKYNSQEKTLVNITIFSAALCAILGMFASSHKNSIIKTILGLAGGTIVGTGIGIGISSYKKNHLMDKYDVSVIPNKNKK
ncbi:MAG: hypothetical protein K2F57_04355 [Candidatus Gastranaerophilales bacterium]|nr:hypothetical protein [Candidatus Gastranaerophilales bacterium]